MRVKAFVLWVICLVALPGSAAAVTVGTVPQLYTSGGTFAVATEPFTAAVGTISDCSDPAAWHVTIDWRDGTTSDASITRGSDASTCDIKAGHTYAQLPEMQVLNTVVTATPVGGGDVLTGSFFVNVRPWAFANLQAAKSSDPTLTWRLFTFTAADSSLYAAVIDWGDGTTTNITPDQGWVRSTHTYPHPGVFNVNVALTRGDTLITTVATRAVISNCDGATTPVGPGYIPPAGTRDGRWLLTAYNDMVGRNPLPADQRAWRAELKRGKSRAAIAREIQRTTAYRGAMLARAFEYLVGRPPSPDEVTKFVPWATTTGRAMVAAALSSDYVEMLRNNDPQAFFDTFTCDALNRASRPGEFDKSITQAIDEHIVYSILMSDEYRQRSIDLVAERLLNRSVTAIRDSALRRRLAHAKDAQAAEVAIVSSALYFRS